MAKYKIGTDLYDLPEEKVESFLSKYPDAVEVTEEIQTDPEGKTNGAVETDAAVAPVTTPSRASMIVDAQPESTELESVDTSGELQPGEQGYYRQEKRKEKAAKESQQDKSNWERFDFLDDAGQRFKISLKSIEQGITRIPTLINEVKFSILKPFLSEEDQEKFNDLNAEEQQAFVNRLGSAQQQAMSSFGIATIPVDAQKSLEKSEEARLQLEDLESELVQFENTIGQDIADGNLGRAVTRTASQAIGTIPSLVQAFIPYVGIPSIVAGEAAKASGEAQRKGKDIDLKTIGYSSVIGASEGLLEIFTKKLGKNVFKSLVNSPKEVVEKNIKDVVLNVSKSAGGEGLSESGTLTINKMADAIYRVDEKAFDNYVLDLVDTFILGTAVGGPLRGTGEAGGLLKNAAEARSVNKELKESQYENLTEVFRDPTVDEGTVKLSENKFTEKFLDFDLKQKLNSGDITTEEAAEIKTNFIQTQGATNSLKPLNLSTKDRAEVIELSKEKKSLENTIKQVDDKALTEPQDQRVKEINELLRSYSARAKTAETARVGQAISQLEKVGIQTLSTEEIQSYLQNNNLVENQEDAIKKSGEGAFIIQNPNTQEQEIIVNKDIGSISDPSHEGLHALIFQTVRKSPDTARRLGESLQEQLNKVDPNLIEDSGIRERLELYSKDPTAVQMEEVLTLFSDTVRNGTVKFNDSTFTKIGDFIRQFLSKLGVKAKFNNGRDVYNFIKDYNKSIESGKLTRGQVRAAKEGVRGKLVGPKIETFVETPTIKESKIYQEVETFKDDLVNEQTKDATAFLIADKLQNEVDRRLKIDVDQETREDITRNFLFDDKRGLLGLLQGYDPARNESIMGYLNSSTPGGKLLDARLIEFYENDPRYNQIVQSTTDEAVQRRAEQVTAEEVVTETATKPEAKAIDPFRIMPDVKETATAEVQKSIADKDVDVTEVTYKELKDVAPYQTVADFFNIPVSRIKNPKDNLRKSDDVANIQRWILKNEPTLKNLFTEANREVVEVTEGNRVIRQGGEPTAIPRNLLNKFYNKGARVGNNFQWTLKPYDRTTFLEAVGIKDGKVDPNFTPRAAEAQTIKGILDMYTRNLGNVAARDIIEGREDIAPAERARAKAEVAKGKPRLMFSKQGLLDVTQARDINKVLKTLGMDSASVPDSKRADIQKSFLDSIEKYKLTENVFLAGAFAFSGAKYKRKADGNVYYELTNGEEIIGIARRDSEGKIRRNKNGKKLFNQPTAEQIVEQFGEGVKLLPGKGRLYYGVNDPAYQIALAEAKKNSEGKNEGRAKRININAVNTDKGKAQAKINMQVLDNVVSQLDRAIKDGMPKELAAMVIAQGYQATTGLIKIAAPFRYFSKNLQYGTSAKQRTGDKFREEHNPPASVVGASIIYGFATNNTSQIMADIKKNYYQTKLSKADDQKLDEAKLDATLPVGTTIADNPAIRFIEAGIDLNSIVNYETGKTIAEELGVSLKPSDVNVDTVFDQNQILKTVLDGTITAKEGQNLLNEIAKLKSIPKAGVNNNNENNTIKFSKQVLNQEILDNLGNADQAMANARNPEAPVKKIRVFDFDDTLARSNSKVLYEMPDGTTGKLNATQFAQKAGELEEQGAKFDFSEFSKVVDGKKGPVFKAIENIVKARGAEDVFILTARPANAAGPIKEFMDALGVNLPIENIVGLGDGKAEAKARWMTGKAAEGYNDFFFVDDAYKNVKAVQDALDVFDVKSKTQQAKVKFSKASDLDKGFNDILENKTGIASEKEYGRVKAEVAGAGKGRLNFFIPPSAEDFTGLLYATLGKGKLGDQQMAWYKTHLLNPYARAMNELSSARIAMMNDYKSLKKQLEIVPKDLRKKVPGEPFTREQAVRVYIWNKQGMDIPGISKKDQADLSKYVSDNVELQVFADRLIAIQKGDQYAGPKEGWPAGTITTDMLEGLNTTKRTKYLEQWQQNADVIFSEKNLNKLEAAYGKPYRKALENMLQRMKTGRNRNFQGDTLTGRVTDWLTGSIGTIMFFNTRSAILQTISSINFVNFTDNNILAAGKAFANQKQYWSDFMTLMNSDFLKERRGGLRINVNEADIADMAKRGGARGVINKLLEFGFTPTQIADSFAIASGGATFYRNRIKSLKKQGMTDAEAEAQAFVDFRETAEESQQSSRPDRISMQQAGQLGRLVLAFANTPAQYARLIKKATSDLKNGRGDAKTNISKIIYYGVAQNLLFNALQQALFAFAFDDDEEDTDEQQKKYVSIANGMMDSLLRGMGLGGAVVSVGKNAIIRIINEMEKKQPKLEKVGYELTKLSPPISAKLSRINQAARSYQWDKKDMIEKGWSLDNPAYLASANVIAALTNIPLDRAVKKTNNVVQATSQDLETWERLALLGGWQDWEIGIDEEKPSNKPQPRKTKSRTKKRKTTKR
jgi:hypothetical protein